MTDPCKGCITAWERGGKQSFIGLSLCFGSGCLLEGQEFLLVYAFVLEKASPKINAGKGLHPYLHFTEGLLREHVAFSLVFCSYWVARP